jgi:diaminohydroxyphosphoribosylaminopyrimidine deaminase/5-amino-6-(5-phosphoribosylamino)uracil reductase
MAAALALARRGLGRTAPNPAVGCVLVRPGPVGGPVGGTVVGRGWTQPGGRPHAETEALARAGAAARGAIAYVTLEPCAHTGRTPPCADALVAAGIGRAVVALGDPDPRVDGKGNARLRAAGIAVTEGVCAAEAAALNEGFLLRQRHGRPLVTLKLATTLDGRIALASGESRWITGPAARRRGHLLRAEHDAILVGSGTALADDPDLTCRLPGLEDRSPLRIVADARLRLPSNARLVRGAAEVPTWLATVEGHPAEGLAPYQAAGVEIVPVDAGPGGGLEATSLLSALGARGLTRLLVEGGGRLAAALLEAGLVDRLAWFRAGAVIGGDGRPAVAGLALRELAAAPRFRREAVLPLGDDLLETYVRAH